MARIKALINPRLAADIAVWHTGCSYALAKCVNEEKSRPTLKGKSQMSQLAKKKIEPDTVRTASAKYSVLHRNIQVDRLNVFYREAGPTNAPTVVLLHG